MMRPFRLAAMLFAYGLSAGVGWAEQGQRSPVLVELFTSQGCVACPPADAFLADLAEREDVLALALHVDYWDYIGWQDTFGSAQFTERQKNYARAIGERSIYTPQMVIAGRSHVVGFAPVEVAQALEAEAALPLSARLTLRRDADALSVELSPAAEPLGAAAVYLIRYQPEAEVEIARGENAGKTVLYANIVTDWQRLSDWDGQAPLALQAEVPGPESIAVVVQAEGMGPVFAAARLDGAAR